MFPSGEPATPLYPLLLAVACQVLSGVPLLFRRGSETLQRLGASLMLAGSLAGLAGAVSVLLSPGKSSLVLAGALPFGAFELALDPLSAFFLVPMFIVTGCAALYGVGYWPAAENRDNCGRLSFFLGLLAASLTTLLLARSTVLFLIAWETMAFAAYFALTAEDEKAPVREAGQLYLITAHLGALALFAMFSLLKAAGGTWLFPEPGALSAGTGLATGIFLTALAGFGLKAGLMPLHVWLPSAHANAPSHISAILSGLVLKTGIYGMMRVFSAFSDPPLWWGGTVLVLGLFSAVLGVAFAIGQHDMKRLLAYHSIENIGIITIGVGIALVGANQGMPALVALGAAGALLHVVNHALFKALLFFAAGSVIHATGTRRIDLLGGVARRLPYTSAFFLVGAVAICGLPPLNGFVSELMIYLASFTALRSSGGVAAALPALAAPVLALVGGLAVACFVKVFGVAFLGAARSRTHSVGREATKAMILPMGFLSLCCAAIGLAPMLVARPLDSALSAYHPALAGEGIASLVPFGWLCVLALGLLTAAAGLVLFLRQRASRLQVAVAPTWGCGYLRPESSMQYTASSFGATLVGWFRAVLRPEEHREEVRGLFPGRSSRESHLPETFLERIYLPFLEYLFRKAAPVRLLQHGKLNIYIFYTFLTLVVLLALTSR